MKKKLLFIYHSMIVGGSTTALLSLLNGLDPEKYEIDLQLFRNKGALLDVIPEYVNLLPSAELHKGTKGRLVKLCKFLFKGYAFRYIWKKCRKADTKSVLAAFQSKELSRKNPKKYDYAVGGLEGWSDWYLAYGTKAERKYGWLHSTYANITSEPTSELPWMEQVDKIVFVTDPCRDAFAQSLPQMAHKAITVANIIDSAIIEKRSLQIDQTDLAYITFSQSDKFKIITVCRLTISVKGLDRIVNAAKTLKEQGYAFLWYIVGDGEDRETLQKMIEAANVADCVVLIGKRMNPYPFIAAADIMCMPSRYEGKPITVTEAMILGTPPVVTEYLSAHEQIKHEQEGVVVPNEEEAIIAPLAEIMADPSVCMEMKQVLLSREYGSTDCCVKLEELFC